MPTEISDVIDGMATTTMSFLGGVVTDYWPYILGLIVLAGLAIRIRRTVGLVR